MSALGARCAHCGTDKELTFDCIIPQGDGHHRKSMDSRVCFYRRQHFEWGNVQVLCASCNARKGSEIPDEILSPF